MGPVDIIIIAAIVLIIGGASAYIIRAKKSGPTERCLLRPPRFFGFFRQYRPVQSAISSTGRVHSSKKASSAMGVSRS